MYQDTEPIPANNSVSNLDEWEKHIKRIPTSFRAVNARAKNLHEMRKEQMAALETMKIPLEISLGGDLPQAASTQLKQNEPMQQGASVRNVPPYKAVCLRKRKRG